MREATTLDRNGIHCGFNGKTRWLERPMGMLIDAAPIAMLVVCADGRILVANQRAVETFEYSSDQLLTMNVDDLVPERIRTAPRLAGLVIPSIP